MPIIRRNKDNNKGNWCNNTTNNNDKNNNDNNDLVMVVCPKSLVHNERMLTIFKHKTQETFRTLIEERCAG